MNEEKTQFNLKVAVQRLGTALSGMVMPNIGGFIAWGIITALFIEAGYLPNKNFAELVGPMLNYLLPLLIAYTGGKNIYGDGRGGVVGAIAAMGVIVGTDIPMFIGAMAMGPLAGWLMKKFDNAVQPKIKAGFEMLVNNFSAGILGFALALFGYTLIGPTVQGLTKIMEKGVQVIIDAHLLPLANVFIEPAKILFLNNAINHGILTPIGANQVAETGKSILFLLEANPGPGLGLLLAFCFFGKGSAKATAPGAVIIHFLGGIHEIYFPYVMMKPALFIAVIAGGVTGTFTNSILGSALTSAASPGSIIAIEAMAPKGLWPHLNVLIGVLAAAIVSFLVAAIILKNDKSMVDDTALENAQADLAASKAVAKGQAPVNSELAISGDIKHIIFACDAGMGSSAMGASILRDKVKKAGLSIDVTNRAIANLIDAADTLVVTQEELAPRAAQMAPSSIRVAVSNFLNSPKYEEIIASLTGGSASDQAGKSVTKTETEIDLKLVTQVVFGHDATAVGSATMGKETLQAIFKNHDVKMPITDVEFPELTAYNAPNIVVVTIVANTAIAKEHAPNAQHLSVDSLITTSEYDKMLERSGK
ncbi:PTS system mannitol-specific EIICB component [Lactococcus hodotermopsidis]|uniref:PTS system mannitol-specific EIICB component n=1 Tax=Pseudolactococcus hodotermopsidis TaxID=2709157 RepID=A0A6A0BHZ0_9LACT|nr:PTS mannitol transporter subunit IICBA [Lactococcus hodotermopsidis]GFH43367.1 PTS system mannitol-specific EIICB component [Lactococcus hodotermopsidis]